MLSEEFIAAVEKAIALKGFDLKVNFDDVEFWDEAIFFTKSLLSERGVEHVTYYHTFVVEFLLENGNLISLTYKVGGFFNGDSY